MRRRNKVFLPIFFLMTTLFLANSLARGRSPQQLPPVSVAGSQTPADLQAPTRTPPVQTSATSAAPMPAPGSATQTAGPSVAPSVSASVSSNSAQNADAADNSVFVFRKQVEEVLLHATVVDDKQHIVTSLDKGDFNVFEDGRPQTITSFRHEDIPVAMGIIVDNSGSMREKRQKVNAAALNLVRSSNPNDEVFIVNFNDEYYLDQDFTSNINK